MSKQPSLFDSATISFEASQILNKDDFLFPIDNHYFGIFQFQAIKTECFNKKYDFVFTIDTSGSMSDFCADGRTKQQHISHTLKNMIWFFHDNPEIFARISIFTFNSTVKQILNRVVITKDNIKNIINEINNIRPTNCTDIGLSLKTVTEFINNSIRRNVREPNVREPNVREPNVRETIVSHIFMTDGDATVGELEPSVLKTMVDNTFSNAFVGFGIDHNDIILDELSSHYNSSYYFVDKLENSGFVYGEILHNLLYKLLVDTKLTIQKGYLYDFKTNSWVSELFIGDIVGETKKDFHIISQNPDECFVQIDSVYFETNRIYNLVIDEINRKDNLTCYIYRQKTLQLLHEVKEYSLKIQNRNKLTNECVRCPHSDDNTTQLIQSKMNNLMKDMKTFITSNSLENDTFMKNLCDDIFICNRTFDTSYSGMYSGARLVSQGSQRCYVVSDTQDAFFDNDFNNDFNNDFSLHALSDFALGPYSTPRTLQVMTSVRDGHDDNNNNNNNDLYTSSTSSNDDNFI